MKKIPCSVGIITLNSGKTLRKTLESVKDFAEIIICDGNSTDNTILIAKEYNCKIIPQYNSKQKNISIKNKSIIRNKTIKASQYPWYFYIDSDDQIDAIALQSIRKIVTDKDPKHLIWRINCKLKIDNKVIKYSSSYPDRRIVLIRKDTNAKFYKAEHEVIKYNKSVYSEGLIKGTMYLCWDESRKGKNYWINAQNWLERDFQANKKMNWSEFWKQGVMFNILAAGGFFYRSILIYLRHGFRDSMPIRIEIYRVLYQLKMLYKHVLYRFFRYE